MKVNDPEHPDVVRCVPQQKQPRKLVSNSCREAVYKTVLRWADRWVIPEDVAYRLKIGVPTARRVCDEMQKRGILTPLQTIHCAKDEIIELGPLRLWEQDGKWYKGYVAEVTTYHRYMNKHFQKISTYVEDGKPYDFSQWVHRRITNSPRPKIRSVLSAAKLQKAKRRVKYIRHNWPAKGRQLIRYTDVFNAACIEYGVEPYLEDPWVCPGCKRKMRHASACDRCKIPHPLLKHTKQAKSCPKCGVPHRRHRKRDAGENAEHCVHRMVELVHSS